MAERKQGTVKRPGLGLLRGTMAKEECDRAEKIAATRGTRGLVVHAKKLLDDVMLEEQRLAALAFEVERAPARATFAIEAYLKATASSEASFEADRKVLWKSKGKRLNLAALTERVAARVCRLELECEVCLALARTRVSDAEAATMTTPGSPDLDALLALAGAKGRWARRVEAFMLLRALTRRMPPASAHRVMACALACASPSEHRWVQPAAVDVLARLDDERARALVRERFYAKREGDDFLVRERFVELAARLRRESWQEILELGAEDPSEHVRLTAARVERDPRRLTHVATTSQSEKVRAAALLALARRSGGRAEATIIQAVANDSSPLVARMAAEGLVLLARRGPLANAASARSAIASAASRWRSDHRTYGRLLEDHAAVSVLGDPVLGPAHELVAKVAPHVPIGEAVHLASDQIARLDDDQLGLVLSVVARDDFGLAADREGKGILLYRGEMRTLAPWRVLHELRRPLAQKRQGYSHTWGRSMRGRLRAPPSGLAELTATAVPGERVVIEKRGDWGRHLPLMDDLLASDVVRGRPTRTVGPSGTTLIRPADSFARRAVGWLKLTMRYAELAERRRRSLESNEAVVQRAFADEIFETTGTRITFVPHPHAASLPIPAELALPSAPIRTATADFAKKSAAMVLLPLGNALDGFARDLLHYTAGSSDNRLPHIGAYAALVLLGMIGKSVAIRRSIDADRQALPLVIGGWGTRGKSGTERLKAGLLQGLGYEVLVKTTGCEAMFIHATPGVRAHEVFMYRPYDKATIWEQRALLRLARRFGVRAFLWECMALQPDLVNVLQHQWMRDDYSTITNAYPDHEDVQGPTGFDVAQVISEFVPTSGRLFTTEDQMLPLLRERAKERDTTMCAVGDHDSALLGDDILARFPYHEHPKNIALVSSLAHALGVPAPVALVEMADNVVPDLGVLKTYPRASVRGRSLAFTNGMSANERTGAYSNWTRMGFDRHTPDREPKRYIVTVVNNRADRVARSEVFGRFVVQDIGAHKHFLIGTNVGGLLGFIRTALDKHLLEIAPTRDLGTDMATRLPIVEARLAKAFDRLKIGTPTVESVTRELTALGMPVIDARVLERALHPASSEETLAAATKAVSDLVPRDYPAAIRPFVVSSIARRRAVAAVRAAVPLYLHQDPARLDATFSRAYRALFEDQLVAIQDAGMTGDQLIDTIAQHAPPGADVDIMGIQNIKGTGLDFVYRWVGLDIVDRAAAKLRAASADERDEGLRALMAHDDYGLVESAAALAAVRGALGRVPSATKEHASLTALARRLEGIHASREAALSAKRGSSLKTTLLRAWGKTFDYLDSMRRQSMAKRVVEELLAGRVSHGAAASEMRTIVARSKGAWALQGQ